MTMAPLWNGAIFLLQNPSQMSSSSLVERLLKENSDLTNQLATFSEDKVTLKHTVSCLEREMQGQRCTRAAREQVLQYFPFPASKPPKCYQSRGHACDPSVMGQRYERKRFSCVCVSVSVSVSVCVCVCVCVCQCCTVMVCTCVSAAL